jgi:hypothetical protein
MSHNLDDLKAAADRAAEALIAAALAYQARRDARAYADPADFDTDLANLF